MRNKRKGVCMLCLFLFLGLFIYVPSGYAECSYKIDPHNASFGCEGGDLNFHANATGDTCLKLECSTISDQLPDWCKGFLNCSESISHFDNGTNQYLVEDEIVVENSKQDSARNATVVIGTKQLLIEQSGKCSGTSDGNNTSGCLFSPKSSPDYGIISCLALIACYVLICRFRKLSNT